MLGSSLSGTVGPFTKRDREVTELARQQGRALVSHSPVEDTQTPLQEVSLSSLEQEILDVCLGSPEDPSDIDILSAGLDHRHRYPLVDELI